VNDPRFSNLGDEDGITEDDEEYLDRIIEEISDDLSRDGILFDEIVVDRDYITDESKLLAIRGISGVSITGREMEVTLRYEVDRP